MRYALVFLAIICSWVSLANTVNAESFMIFNTGNGKLKHNTAETLCRDQMGFLWVGTNFGLNRLDGYTTINYTNNPKDTTSISANFIKCVYNDSKNNLWVGTIGGGLNLYDRANNSFKRFLPSDKRNSISSYNVTTIVEDNDGNIWIGSASKKLNKYIVKQNTELEQANITKDKFFSLIGHDLRNPMANVNQLVDLVITEFKTAPKEQIMSYLEVLKRSSETTIKLLDDLLIWSHTQNGKMEAKTEIVAINNLFATTIETCQLTAAKKNIQLNNLNEDELKVVCDENMMLTVLRNIVTNAIKFSYPNSEIFMDAHQRGENIIISITDEGKGMSEKQLSNLFKIENVLSTEGTGGETGSGLGLIICKEFVHANNGAIWAESKKDIGTTFFIALPCPKN